MTDGAVGPRGNARPSCAPAFDRAFAAPLRADAAAKHDLLAIRVGARTLRHALSEIAGLFADRKITRVPGSNAALLGIAGFRGAIVPVYSLPDAARAFRQRSAPRWLVIAAAAPVALAFDAFEGHLRVLGRRDPAAAIARADARLRPEFIRTARCRSTGLASAVRDRCARRDGTARRTAMQEQE